MCDKFKKGHDRLHYNSFTMGICVHSQFDRCNLPHPNFVLFPIFSFPKPLQDILCLWYLPLIFLPLMMKTLYIILRQRVVDLLEAVESVVTNGCENSEDRFKIADIQQILSALFAVTQYQPYLSFKAVVRYFSLFKTFEKMNECGENQHDEQ